MTPRRKNADAQQVGNRHFATTQWSIVLAAPAFDEAGRYGRRVPREGQQPMLGACLVLSGARRAAVCHAQNSAACAIRP